MLEIEISILCGILIFTHQIDSTAESNPSTRQTSLTLLVVVAITFSLQVIEQEGEQRSFRDLMR